MYRVANVIVAITLFVAGLLGFARTNAPRSLAEGELWQLWGGTDIANRCCSILAGCALQQTWCGQAADSNACSVQNQYDLLPGNRKACITQQPMTTCTESGTHVCAEQHNCVWDDQVPDGVCIKNFNTLNANAPDSCSPDC